MGELEKGSEAKMSKKCFVVGLLFCLAAVSAAQAGLLASDPNGMVGFTGSMNFASGTMSATVDYAVFSPGTYPNDFITGKDPSNGTEYVYAYQVFPTGQDPTTTLAVGRIAPNVAHNAMVDALHVTVGGVQPSTWNVLSSSVYATFMTPELESPNHSRVLLFTSPSAPGWAPGSVGNGGQSDQKTLPTPIPEPAGLLGMLAVGYGLLRRVRL
jgi:hypothetical protein